jgi:hypothetical protein
MSPAQKGVGSQDTYEPYMLASKFAIQLCARCVASRPVMHSCRKTVQRDGRGADFTKNPMDGKQTISIVDSLRISSTFLGSQNIASYSWSASILQQESLTLVPVYFPSLDLVAIVTVNPTF